MRRVRRGPSPRVCAIVAALALVAPAPGAQTPAPERHPIVVDAAGRGDARALTAGLQRARAGDRIVVRAGTYREPTIVVRTPNITIEGDGWPVFDGESARTVLVVEADSVTVRGLVLARTGVSHMEDRSGIRVRNASACLIEGNRLEDNLFGVYLERTADCVVRGNEIGAHGMSQSTSGNGVHLWYAPRTLVEGNRIQGHRDGIYFEFSGRSTARDNVAERNQRYGLHFMYSDSCRYERNTFRDNTSGVAVMYSREVAIVGNTFARATGGGAYGLLLKEILGGEIRRNAFTGNSTGVLMEGASHLAVADNDFVQNGWGVRVLASAVENRFTGNHFAGNAFDVTTNSRSNNSVFEGNWWDAYRGYDLDRDGYGDVPFRPVRLFALVVEKRAEALLLLRSPLVAVLDVAERVLPVLTPEALVDRRPLMRSPR